MSRGRGFSSSRGSTYRGNSNRGGSSWGSSRGYNSSRGSNARFSSFPNSFETPRPKYPGPPDRYNSSRAHGEEYRKPYRPVSYFLLSKLNFTFYKFGDKAASYFCFLNLHIQKKINFNMIIKKIYKHLIVLTLLLISCISYYVFYTMYSYHQYCTKILIAIAMVI